MRASLAALVFLASATVCAAEGVTSCHTQAKLAAAEWAGPVLTPAASTAGARPTDAILLISAGEMFTYKPANGNDVRIIRGVGRMVRDYNLVWHTEFDRCIGGERGLVIIRY